MFKLADSYDIVTCALAAMSAERLALMTNSSEASVVAINYRSYAFRNAGKLMQPFSMGAADAVLAALLACSYQMTDSFVPTATQVYDESIS